MAVVRHSSFFTGLWPQLPPGLTLQMAQTSNIMDALDERSANMGRVRWDDRGTHDIASVAFLVGDGTVGTGSTVRISLQDVSLTAGPPMQPDGIVDQSWSGPTPSPNTFTEFTLDTPRLNVAHGDLLAVVSEFTVFGSGSQFRDTLWFFADNRPLYQELSAFYSGGSWAGQGRIPAVLLRSSDGAIGTIGWIPFTSGSSSAEQFNSSSVPDERGMEFVAEFPWEIDELWALAGSAEVGGDYDIVLYEGDAEVRSVSFHAAAVYNNGTNNATMARAPVAPFVMTQGATYRVVVKPTTTADVNFSAVVITDPDHRVFWCGMNAGYVSRADGGAWDAMDTLKLPMCGVGISGMDDGTGPDISGSHLIEGVVTHEGTVVSGATVRLIRQSDNGVLTTTTDVNGEYSFSVAEGYLYHAMVEYETGGARYSAKSLFDLEPTIA